MLEWDLPSAKWFVGAQTNLSYNCLDRHLDGPRRDKTAIIWEGEPGEIRRLTLTGHPFQPETPVADAPMLPTDGLEIGRLDAVLA